MFADSPTSLKRNQQSPIKKTPQDNFPQALSNREIRPESTASIILNNANTTNNAAHYQQEKESKVRKFQNKNFRPQKQDTSYEAEAPKSSKLAPSDDWKLSVVSGDELCSVTRKVSKSTLLMPGRLEILGDTNNSSNERLEIRSEDITSTPTSDQQDFFLQEISQFPSNSQANLSSFLMKRYKPQAPENDIIYSDVLKRIIRYLHKSWLNQSMCDAIISTDSGDILTHQVILAAYSPTLESLFEQNKRPLPQFVQINMNDYPKDTIIDIVNFLYTTNLKVDCKSVANLVAVARQLDLPEIINICGSFLTKNYDHDNIFLHYSVAANNLLRNSKNYLVKVIAMNFSLLVHHNHFLYIPIDRLNEILSHESLSGEELDILLAVIKWIDFNRQERIQFSKQLFSHIRFELVDPEAIANQVEIHDWLFSDKTNKELISEAYKYHALVGLSESSKNIQRSHKQLETNVDSFVADAGNEDFSLRSLNSRRSNGVNGSNNTNNRTWRVTHHNNSVQQQQQQQHQQQQQQQQQSECPLEMDKIHFVPESLNELYQQQRQIQLTQLQLEKMQRQLLEHSLQPAVSPQTLNSPKQPATNLCNDTS